MEDDLYGGRVLEGDELRASKAADELRTQVEQRIPFPTVTRDTTPEALVTAFVDWRKAIAPIEAGLRDKGNTARASAASLRAMIELSADTELLSRDSLERTLRELDCYVMFTVRALQTVCRKGDPYNGNPTKADQSIDTEILLLHVLGLSKSRIALLVKRNRRDVTRKLSSCDAEFIQGMRVHLGLELQGE